MKRSASCIVDDSFGRLFYFVDEQSRHVESVLNLTRSSLMLTGFLPYTVAGIGKFSVQNAKGVTRWPLLRVLYEPCPNSVSWRLHRLSDNDRRFPHCRTIGGTAQPLDRPCTLFTVITLQGASVSDNRYQFVYSESCLCYYCVARSNLSNELDSGKYLHAGNDDSLNAGVYNSRRH